VGRRIVARGSTGGGERIPASRQSGRRLTTAAASLALAGSVAVYAFAAGERLTEIVGGVAAAGCALIVLALAFRRAAVFPFGIAGVGAAYALFLALRNGDVDARAPAVAAVLFVATELGYWSLEASSARSERAALLRRVASLALAAFATALVGSLVLGLTSGAGAGIALEAVGVAAAALTAAAISLLASRASV
jgi:hypothetical protein